MKLLALAIVRLAGSIMLISARPITSILLPEPNTMETSTDLYVGDNLLCNQQGCYPKIFQANEEWKTVKEGQILPKALNIRMNLDTGLKEARLQDNNVGSMVPASVSPHSETQYEFTGDFQMVEVLLHNLHSVEDVEKLENKLDDLMIFAHDYGHGSKIITHEFDLLRDITFQPQFPPSLRELGIRMVISCLRNNAKSIQHVQKTHPEFVPQVFQELCDVPPTIVLTRRYLSVLELLLPSAYDFTKDEMSILEKTYKVGDTQNKIKILELISKCFGSADQLDLSKSELTKIAPNVNEWAQELQKWIQDESIDEIHIRKFFNSLYNIKTSFDSEIKVDPSFVDWLSSQTGKRKQNLVYQNEKRDIEQASFDKKLVESRHLVFGNPMAHRIKHFSDEL